MPKKNRSITLEGNAEAQYQIPHFATDIRAGVNRVSFSSDGETLIGNLYLPTDYQPGQRLPAVVVVGSLTSFKEQMSGLYAERLADQGFAALAFDYRYFGESSGEPRQYESPQKHSADIRNAVSFLQTVPVVDPQRIGGLGVCTGGAYMGVAAADDPHIKAYAGVALHVTAARTSPALYGGEQGIQERRVARQHARFFEQIQTPQKRLLWRTEPHFDFYDREASKMAANEVASHFKATL